MQARIDRPFTPSPEAGADGSSAGREIPPARAPVEAAPGPLTRRDDAAEAPVRWSAGVIAAVGHGAEADRVDVVVDGRAVSAGRAASCLLAPRAGDRVAVVEIGDGTGPGAAFVVAILERPEPGSDSRLSAPGERLVIAADRLDLEARRSVAVRAPQVTLVASRLSALCRDLVQSGASLLQVFRSVRTAGASVETDAGTLRTAAQARYERITGLDHQAVETVVQEVASTALQTSHASILLATEDVRMDAKRVTMG